VKNAIAGARVTSQWLPSGRAPPTIRFQTNLPTAGRPSPLAAWLALAGVILPFELQFFIAGAKFTPGRIGIILLFFPALLRLCQRRRSLILSDFFACATATWMIAADIYIDGLGSISSAGAECLEFIGGYVVGRGLFFGLPALVTFIRVLKVLVIVSIILALADVISGRLIVHDIVASIVHTRPPNVDYRLGIVRAASTFDHPILFGSFCCLVAPILLYSERNVLRRTMWVGLSLLGCILSLSSGPILAFLIVLGAYVYDQLLKLYPWRWGAFWVVVTLLIGVMFLVANDPVASLIARLTLDPHNGYYRLMIWDYALEYIRQAPFTGFAFNRLDNQVLDTTVDCVWLVFAIRFGVPMSILLFLTNIAAFMPARQTAKNRVGDVDRMCTAFTTVLAMFMFIGLTVHFWNFMWIFWGLCIGIRASLRELVSRPSQPTRIPVHSLTLKEA
jgi:O-Antigen ligase